MLIFLNERSFQLKIQNWIRLKHLILRFVNVSRVMFYGNG